MPELQPDIQKQLNQVGQQLQTMVTNIRDRYNRKPAQPVTPINFPSVDYGRNTKRGMLIPMTNIGEDLPVENAVIFQFNPEEVEHDKKITISEQERTGFAYDIPFWSRGGARTVNFKLFMDATAGSSYRIFTGKSGFDNSINASHVDLSNLPDPYSLGLLPEIQKLEKMQYPVDRDNKRLIGFTNGVANVYNLKQFSTIPFVVFSYGSFMALCYLAGMPRKDILFNKALNPIRSEIQIQLRVIESKVIDTNFINRSSTLNKLLNTNDTK